MMKKYLYLLVIIFSILGCSYNSGYKNISAYKLETENYNSVEEMLDSFGLQLKDDYSDDVENITYYDYLSYYFADGDIYLFQYNNKNFIMKDLDNYVCFNDVKRKVKEKDLYSLDVYKDTFYTVVDKLGLPHQITRSGNYSYYYYYVEGYKYNVKLYLYYGFYPTDELILKGIYITKEWG